MAKRTRDMDLDLQLALAMQEGEEIFTFYDDFKDIAENEDQLPHAFAVRFQRVRARFHVGGLLGQSGPAQLLREVVLESIFTREPERHGHLLFERTPRLATLVEGPPGSGKRRVAMAIARSQYIPFDWEILRFQEDYDVQPAVLDAAAVDPQVAEALLFGRGSEVGLLEACSRYGTVILAEVGALRSRVQSKVAGVLQSGVLQRLDSTEPRNFRGKLVATNTAATTTPGAALQDDLATALSADRIKVPSLASMLAADADELLRLVSRLAEADVGEGQAEAVAQETTTWIVRNLGLSYPWPGNLTELQQCIRGVVLHGRYYPLGRPGPAAATGFLDRVLRGEPTADEVLRYYCTLVYRQTGTYEKAARRLGLDRRTVRAKVDAELLSQLEGGE